MVKTNCIASLSRGGTGPTTDSQGSIDVALPVAGAAAATWLWDTPGDIPNDDLGALT